MENELKREDQARILRDAGLYLEDKRKKKGITSAEAAEKLGISRTYLSEIENGRKLPSDKLIQDLADFYGISEVDLFQRLGKVPLAAREELLRSQKLQRTLTAIGRDKRLSDEDKEKLFDNIFKMYSEFIKEVE